MITDNPLYRALARMLRERPAVDEGMRGPVEDAVVAGADKRALVDAMRREASDPEQAGKMMGAAGMAGPLRVVGQYGYSPQLFHGSAIEVKNPRANARPEDSWHPEHLRAFYTSKSPDYAAAYGGTVNRYEVKPGTKILETNLSPVKMPAEDIERFASFAEGRNQLELAKRLRARDPELTSAKDFAIRDRKSDMEQLIHEYAIANNIPISGIDEFFELLVRDPSVLKWKGSTLKKQDFLGTGGK